MRGSPLSRGTWVLFCAALAATTISIAGEPLDELVLGARVASVDVAGKVGTLSGVATIEVDLRALRDASEVRLRVLDAGRSPWRDPQDLLAPGAIEWNDEAGAPVEADPSGALALGKDRAVAAVLRVPLRGRQVHEILLEATGIVDGRTIRTETALRAPLGVPGFEVEDDGETAAFRLEVRP